MSASVRKESATVAIRTRYKGANAPETLDARRNLAEAKISECIERSVAAAPPLRADQVDRLIALLKGCVS